MKKILEEATSLLFVKLISETLQNPQRAQALQYAVVK
jgi:hypothetical protein